MLAIANTDHSWFVFHREKSSSRPINFWTPTPWKFKAISPGERFYFMRKAPIRKVGGLGIFREYIETTPIESWERWGEANGFATYEQFLSKISSYPELRSVTGGIESSTPIGNIILENPVFFEESQYIDLEEIDVSFPRQVVKYKSFPLDDLSSRTGSSSDDRKKTTGPTTGPPPRSGGYSVPPRDPDSTQSFTYIARFGKTKVYKIGWANTPEERLKSFNQHIPSTEVKELEKWEMIYIHAGSSADSQKLEQHILTEKLDDYRTEGERVFCGKKIIDEIALELDFIRYP